MTKALGSWSSVPRLARAIDQSRSPGADHLAGISAADVLDYFTVRITRRDGRLALVRQCPRCGPRASACVAVAADGRWFCESNRCRGELADLIVGYANANRDALEDIAGEIRRASTRSREIRLAAARARTEGAS